MKRGAPEHPKMAALAARLDIARPHAVGLMEMLWHFTSKYAPAGNVGKFADQHIEEAVGWDGEPGQFIHQAIYVGFLDAHPEHRLVVHDWREHADDAVHMALGRACKRFADGTPPRITRLNKDERERAERAYSDPCAQPVCTDRVHTPCTQNVHGPCALPTHPTPSPPLPSPPIPPPAEPPANGESHAGFPLVVGGGGSEDPREMLLNFGVGEPNLTPILARNPTPAYLRATWAGVIDDPKVNNRNDVFVFRVCKGLGLEVIKGRKRDPTSVGVILAAEQVKKLREMRA